MIWLVVVKSGKVRLVELGEALGSAVKFCHSHQSIQGNDGVGTQSVELVVERNDLMPVSGFGGGLSA